MTTSLARLREFSRGMNVEEYLTTEFRQNLRSLDTFIAQQSAPTAFQPTVEFLSVSETNFRPVASTTSYVNLSSSNNYLRSGRIENNFYYPVPGRYLFEMSGAFEDQRLGTGFFQIYAQLIDNNGVRSAGVFYNDSSFRIQVFPSPGYAIVDVPSNVGYRIELFSTGSIDVIIYNVMFKVTRVG